MKPTKFTFLLVLGLVLTFAASGCRKRPVGVTDLPGARTAAVPDIYGARPIGAEPPPIDNRNIQPQEIPSNPRDIHQNWIENRAALEADTVHFAFDSSVVKATEKSRVTAVADYLRANPAQAVKIEGHCDERGTEEYNRSLGERRALALREELVKDGVVPTRVDTISFGKDRPADPGHDEAAWSKNRRGEFIVLTPPVNP